LTVYMIPDARELARLLPSHFAPFVRYGYLFGEVHTTPTFDAVAVWLPVSGRGDHARPGCTLRA
jgi:hypothetical protein